MQPKGTLVLETGQMFQRAGYRVKILNTINFSKSMKYNPFVYIHSEKDVLKLVNGITGNLSGLFDNVNAKVGEIASDVGSTPQAWNSGIFNMLRSLSETVVLPIAAAILALVMCHELIQMITEKNNMQKSSARCSPLTRM